MYLAGLFDWSMNHSDGTRPASNVKQMDPERYAFLSSALQHYVVDLPKRLKEIKLEMDVHLERIQSGSGAEGLASAETLMDEARRPADNLGKLSFTPVLRS